MDQIICANVKHTRMRATQPSTPHLNASSHFNPKYRGNRVASACGYLNSQRLALSQAERTVTVGRHRIAITCAADGNGCVRVCVRAHACMHDVFAYTKKKIFYPG